MTPSNPRRALRPTEIVTQLAQLSGWQLVGDGPDVAIEKVFRFIDYAQTMSFVNAVAYIAQASDHHPDMWVGFQQCTVRYRTHDVAGLSQADFLAAQRVDALLSIA